MTKSNIQSIFDAQRQNHKAVKLTLAKHRIAKLKKLKKAIEDNEDLVQKALWADLRKSGFEASVTEIIFTYGEIDFAIKNLSTWMKPKRVGKTASSLLAKNRILYDSKGVCLIMAPWNYPFQLVMSPLVSAISAGNCCMVKPSEISSNTSSVIAKILTEVFEESEVCCLEGDGTLAEELLKLPFDHIFFTGSTAIGKKVMESASQNLTSVTLELGGKSPVLIDQNVNLEQVAEKIAWGKLVNAGQTCIAPDYVLIHQSRLDEFIGIYKSACQKLFFKNDKVDTQSYGKIVSRRHFDRLKALVEDAVDKGARIDFGGTFDESSQTIYPVILSRIPEHATIMEEEIFGPILPVIPYGHLDEAINFINRKTKPLALYIFSERKAFINEVLSQTSSGGVCVNDVLVHISNPKLPFGGVNHSGIGSSHGFHGFKNFSHERAIVYQSKTNFNKMIYPPYENKNWVLKLLKKLM